MSDDIIAKNQINYIVPNIVDDLENGITIDDRLVHAQPIRNLTTTIQIIDTDGSVIDTIEGKATAGSINVAGDSLTKRTGTLTMIVDPAYMPQDGGVMWYNKKFKLYQGIEDLETSPHKTINFLLGTFLLDETTLSISATDSSISLKLSDKMTQYDDNTLEHELLIPQGTPITEAMRKVMELVGETSFGQMDESASDEVVPYDYTKEVGSGISDIITELRDMYMDYTCGYNVKGEFEFRKLKIQQKDIDTQDVKWEFDSTATDRSDLTLSFSETYNLKNVKNRIVVYGATNSATGLTPEGVVRITDSKNPFNVDAIGTRTKVIVDSKLSNDIQCVTEAQYNIWQTAHFQEQCTISCLPIYIIDAYDIVTIVNPETKEKYRYMVDSFSIDLAVSGEMSLTTHKMYYVTLEYGDQELPIVAAVKKGVNQLGWLSLGEQRIKDCYGISGSGDNQLVVRFISDQLGGEQAAVTGYTSTKTQTLEFDLADLQKLDLNSEDGDTGRSTGDYCDRVLAHEMFHAVCNDYYGASVTLDMPTWFKEGFAELVHGGKERYQSITGFKTVDEKKQYFVNKASKLLDGYWESTSEDYVAATLLAAAIYYLCGTKEAFQKIFTNLKSAKNINLNFLTKLLQTSTAESALKTTVINKLKTMDLWQYLNSPTDTDTCSIGGNHLMNLYNQPLDAHNVFNESLSTTPSLGFKILYD